MLTGRYNFCGFARREPGIPIGTPLHGSADAVAVPEINVVAHSDLIAVINDRSAGHREQQSIHHLDTRAIIAKQRSEPPPDAQD